MQTETEAVVAGEYLALLPAIERFARFHLLHVRRADREEAVADAVAEAFLAFARLKKRGKDPAAFPSTLARFAALAATSGRLTGIGSSGRDVFSRRAQRRHGFAVRRFGESAVHGDAWWRDVVDGRRAPVPDQAAMNVDFPSWLDNLPPAQRQTAELLAQGHATHAAAEALGISAARVSQLRSVLRAAWSRFHGECDEQYATPINH